MLIWNVFCEHKNKNCIETFNIFKHIEFYDDCVNAAKKYENDFVRFSNEIESSLMHHFWSKCEWEIVLDSWPSSDRFRKEKIDVFDQVHINWNTFIHWLWDHRIELLKVDANDE